VPPLEPPLPEEDPELLPLEDPELLPLDDPELLPLEDPELLPLDDPELLPLEDPELLPLDDPELLPDEDEEELVPLPGRRNQRKRSTSSGSLVGVEPPSESEEGDVEDSLLCVSVPASQLTRGSAPSASPRTMRKSLRMERLASATQVPLSTVRLALENAAD
jgi:hypothetical protein